MLTSRPVSGVVAAEVPRGHVLQGLVRLGADETPHEAAVVRLHLEEPLHRRAGTIHPIPFEIDGAF